MMVIAENCAKVCEYLKYLVSEAYYFKCYSNENGNGEKFTELPKSGSGECSSADIESGESMIFWTWMLSHLQIDIIYK